VRTDGTVTVAVANGDAVFTVVKLNPAGAPDITFGTNGIAAVAVGTGSGPGIGASAIRGGSSNSILVAGTDLSPSGTPRGAVIRLAANGALDTKFGSKGFARISRAGREIRISAMVRDSDGRILLTGTGLPPDSLVVRLRANGARDKKYANGGLTYPVFGQPPGGDPVYTELNAIDVSGAHALLVGAAAGPGKLVRSINGTTYTGRFALTVSRLQ
jgi:uncharacterized delta-60 repeat protein